nr:MAG TPA: hypothetical protein [Caudoviricetes sp.]
MLNSHCAHLSLIVSILQNFVDVNNKSTFFSKLFLKKC